MSAPELLVVALAALWECGVASGMDTDGDAGPGAMVAGMGVEGFARAMVNQVEQLRADYDECLDCDACRAEHDDRQRYAAAPQNVDPT